MAQEINQNQMEVSAMEPEGTERSGGEMTDRNVTMTSAALAFLGDSVYELFIRNRIVCSCEGSADALNKRSKALTNAKAQAHIADRIQDLLTAQEMAVYKRGRNFKSLTAPRSCSISEYRRATGVEALMGYLFLQGDRKRIEELILAGIQDLEE